MPKRSVPSGLKRASGMLMSPVGPAFAKEVTQHATTPTQHARKRRIAPLQRCLPSPSQKRGNAGRAPRSGPEDTRRKAQPGELELRAFMHLQKQQNPARVSLAGFRKYSVWKPLVVGRGLRARRRDSRY